MKRILKSPAANAIGISLFTAFYAFLFLAASGPMGAENHLEGAGIAPPWPPWRDFLTSGQQVYIAYALIAVTILVVALLMTQQRPYDEYHTSILTNCLVVAAILVLAAIAVFYVMILRDPSGLIEKFTLFIVIHWTTVVFSDLAYVLLCRWR